MILRRSLFALFVALLCTLFGAAVAQEDPDLAALQLADTAQTKPNAPSNWHTFLEGALGGAIWRSDDTFQSSQRLSLDLQYDNTFAAGWRFVFSDRLDADNPAQPPNNNTINTIKETYLSWQTLPGLLFDVGRINERSGVALGYNPTDYFKTGAVRSIVSVDPNSLKQNRQGSVMLRAQELFDDGSLTVLASPRIDGTPDNASFNPDLGATNSVNRYLISVSPKFGDNFNPKFLIYHTEQMSNQFGLNLTGLVDDATVIYAEWSGGRSASLLQQSLQQSVQDRAMTAQDDTAFRHHLASGVTYTTDNKISLTLEYEYNGAALTEQRWDSLQHGPLALYGAYRTWLQITQESPTRHAGFLFVTWQDAIINHLDLSGMARNNLDDASRLTWLEARYHFSQCEFALQWQLDSGHRLSEYGATPQVQTWALLGRVYF